MLLISGSSFYISVWNLHISEVGFVRNNQGNFIKPKSLYKLDSIYTKYPLDVYKCTTLILKYFVFLSNLWLDWKELCAIKKDLHLLKKQKVALSKVVFFLDKSSRVRLDG